ncbi:response regulator [Legionella sp. km772]|uniref:response regulator n=1 Tax=Legionella sp. km772 TaxID=2498111 RepID=UPI000F8D676B|nr:response regulator [Legionella sp. km772]RUR04335.1 response regulator [Legionella sp. km772]
MNKQCIYIIDDNNHIGESIKFLVESINDKIYKIEYYQDPMRFLDRKLAQLQGCVIVDLFMPQINGFELIKKLRRENNFINIIVMSGNCSDSMEKRAIDLGAQAFFPKPFNIEHLLKQVFSMLANSQVISAKRAYT